MKTRILFIIVALFLPSAVFAVDTDTDGLSDDLERVYYTDPADPDTDGDGFQDGMEVALDFSPHVSSSKKMHEHDYDGDGLNDWLERWFGSDMGKLDSDRDGFPDFDEVMAGYSPASSSLRRAFAREIVVDRTNQQLYYFVDGVKILNYPVSTGNPWTPTPAGSFAVQRKVPVVDYIGPDYNLPGAKWNMQFKPRYYIHGAYWHNDFGIRTRSHGCVNMRYDDVAVLYRYADVGVPVKIIGDTPRRMFVGT